MDSGGHYKPLAQTPSKCGSIFSRIRSNRHPMTPTSRRPPRQPIVDFLVRRRARILSTVVLALVVDNLGGWLLQHNLASVNDPKAFLGLASVLSGLTLLAWAAGSHVNRPQLNGNGPCSFIEKPIYVGVFASLLGLCLLINDPKNIWLLLGPVILLDLVRIAREDSSTSCRYALQRQAYARLSPARAKGSYRPGWQLRLGRVAPVLIVPIVTLAVIGYASPLVSLQFHELCEIFCLLLSFVGLAIRMLAAGYIPDRSPDHDGTHPTTRPLITDGIYSIVRHPRYLGDYCIGLGVVLIPFVWWLPVLYTLGFWLSYRRIITVDDDNLHRRFGKRYDQWMSATPAMLPNLLRWRPADSPFSFRTALKREHAGLFLVIALHSSIEWLEHLVLERRVMLELFWIVLAAIGLSVFFVVRQLERHTQILNAPAP
jgi:protein-S-isoprenylcysteine O-methyltransferase Ste14